MLKYVFVFVLLSGVCCETSTAQGILRGKGKGGLRNLGGKSQTSDDSTNRRQDVEGTIWEFKVIDPKEKDASKETTMTGRIRIKQTSLFAVGKVKIANQEGMDGKDREGKRKLKQDSSDIRGQLKNRLSGRMDQSSERSTGGERIGDYSKAGSNKYNFEFDQDDDYPLSGLVKVEPDMKKKNGVWSGNYEEFAGGKKVKRWRFEMRKIEE